MEISIETFLSRKEEVAHPVARLLAGAPVVGPLARAWIKATGTLLPRGHWVVLPPVVV